MTVLRNIGRWTHDDDPDLRRLIDESWDQGEADEVADYLEHGLYLGTFISSPQSRQCRLCEFRVRDDIILTDGVYVWRSLFAHYVGAHKVRLPSVIWEDMMERFCALEEAEQDIAWWRDVVATQGTLLPS